MLCPIACSFRVYCGKVSFLGCLWPVILLMHIFGHTQGPSWWYPCLSVNMDCSIRVSGRLAESIIHWLLLPTFVHAKLHQVCLTLCDPMDHSLPGSSVHGHENRRGLPCPSPGIEPELTQELNRNLIPLLHWQVGSLPLVPPENPSFWSLPNSSCLFWQQEKACVPY